MVPQRTHRPRRATRAVGYPRGHLVSRNDTQADAQVFRVTLVILYLRLLLFTAQLPDRGS